MAKTRNFKQGISNSRKDELRLKSILNEVRTSHVNRLNKIKRENAVINESALKAMLSSGFLTEDQSYALSLYFNANGIKSINESTVRRIDRYAMKLNEGPFDWAKKMYDKGKDVIVGAGKKVISAFQKGWTAVKAVWSNFKDLISELVDKIKVMLKKAYDYVYTKVKAVAGKISGNVDEKYIEDFHEKHDHKHEDLIAEFGQLKQTIDHLKGDSDALLTGEAFEKQMIDGSVEPDGTVPPLKPEEAEQGLEDLATEAKQMYLSIFSDKQHLSELQKLKLTEGGHIEDNIKQPVVKFIVHWGLKILKAIFSPFSTLVAEVGKLVVGKGLLKGTSYFCAKYKAGPGVFKFAILTTLVGELLELIEDGLNAVFHFAPIMAIAKSVSSVFGPLAVPLIDCSETVLHIAHYAIAGMALATIIYNLMPVFKAVMEKLKGNKGGENAGGEPEVQAAGYKPNGTFKLQEGNLIFVK